MIEFTPNLRYMLVGQRDVIVIREGNWKRDRPTEFDLDEKHVHRLG